MFHHPGKQLKSVAKVLFWIGVVFSVILVLVLVGATAVTDTGNTIAGALVGGLLYAVILITAIWISCLSLYAMGHMVETLDAIKKNSDQVWAQKAQTQDAE